MRDLKRNLKKTNNKGLTPTEIVYLLNNIYVYLLHLVHSHGLNQKKKEQFSGASLKFS